MHINNFVPRIYPKNRLRILNPTIYEQSPRKYYVTMLMLKATWKNEGENMINVCALTTTKKKKIGCWTYRSRLTIWSR